MSSSHQTLGCEAMSEVMDLRSRLTPPGLPLSPISVSVLDDVMRYGRLAPVIQYVSRNHSELIRLETLAKIAGMERTAFSRYFSRSIGVSVFRFISLYKTAKCLEMLYNTDENISNIAFTLGFESVGSLSRLVRKVTGIAPSEYRRLAREGRAA